MKELELKYMISRNAYMKILSGYMVWARIVPQVNYYYDTPTLNMNKAGITCRIRERCGRFTATIKTHFAKHCGESTERTVSAVSRSDISLFSQLGVSYRGSLITERAVRCPSSGLIIMLDRNTYLGKTDFELEIEYSAGRKCEAERLANKLICDTGEIPSASKLSKSERFFQRMNECQRCGSIY